MFSQVVLPLVFFVPSAHRTRCCCSRSVENAVGENGCWDRNQKMAPGMAFHGNFQGDLKAAGWLKSFQRGEQSLVQWLGLAEPAAIPFGIQRLVVLEKYPSESTMVLGMAQSCCRMDQKKGEN